jgi:hypothetical protein
MDLKYSDDEQNENKIKETKIQDGLQKNVKKFDKSFNMMQKLNRAT